MGSPVVLALSSAWLVVVAWLIWRAWRQRKLLPRLRRASATRLPRSNLVCVIVPARNEAANIGTCLAALLGQDYPAFQVLVVDDQSSDETPIIAAAMCRCDTRVALLNAPPLPPGWMGKSHACHFGALAVPAETEWLCFIDADVRGEPTLLSSAVAAARVAGIELLSLAPRQELLTFAERLVMPCGLYMLAFSQKLEQIQKLDSDDAAATGQFLLVRRTAYEAVGGHQAVRGEICEDLELARRVKRSGRRVALFDGGDLLSTRMYTGWRTLWFGLSKNVVDMLRGPLATSITAIVGMTLGWAALLVPAGAALSWRHGNMAGLVAFVLAAAASAAAFALHVAGSAFLRIPLWYGLLFPLGYTAGALIALDSVRRRFSGRIVWKGRTYR
jgi:chlorobactene glucosyltransferase